VLSLIDNGELIKGLEIKRITSLHATQEDNYLIGGGVSSEGDLDIEDDVSYYVSIEKDSSQRKIFKVVTNPWVIPWYNVDADTYRKVRGEDLAVSAATNDKQIDFTKDADTKWIRLLMPRNKRKVEVEDLNRNFWVIGQCLSGITSYLFDRESPLSQFIKSALDELAKLWENILFLWAANMILSQDKTYNYIHKEIIMLSPTDYGFDMKYDNIQSIVAYNYSEIWDIDDSNQIWNDFVAQISQRLDFMINKYADSSLLIVPCIRGKNY